jgi:UDP-N-acetylmuramoylalanine--D-glutamate ligase
MLAVAGQRIHVIGLGVKGTGRACAQVLGARGALITISDEKTPAALAQEVEKLGEVSVRLQLGPAEAYRDLETADLIVPSPGVPLTIAPLMRARAAGVRIVSEIELAYQLTPGPIIAITGTKGKTTTTTLIGLFLKALQYPSAVGGNIGQPLIELAAEATADTVLVAEVSSFQLEAIESFRPHIAVFTNLYPDHLDRYANSMAAYFAAKLRVFAAQTPDDFAVINVDRPESEEVAAATAARIVRVSPTHPVAGGVYVDDEVIVSELQGTATPLVALAAIRLKGSHNLANILEALAAVEALGLPVAHVASEVLSTFRGVPNRLEEVDVVDGVTFYNDSQGTTPIAVQMALQAFAPQAPVLIAGGRPKISDFAELGRDISTSAHALVVIGEAAELIATAVHEANPNFPVYRATTLPEAVRQAFTLAKPAGIVLLSPACASFDMFRNMEHRGGIFRDAVAALKG